MKIGFMALLALVFITLKLCGVIAWSWWLVLLPLYIGAAIIVGLLVISILGFLGFASLSHIADLMKGPKKF